METQWQQYWCIFVYRIQCVWTLLCVCVCVNTKPLKERSIQIPWKNKYGCHDCFAYIYFIRFTVVWACVRVPLYWCIHQQWRKRIKKKNAESSICIHNRSCWYHNRRIPHDYTFLLMHEWIRERANTIEHSSRNILIPGVCVCVRKRVCICVWTCMRCTTHNQRYVNWVKREHEKSVRTEAAG